MKTGGKRSKKKKSKIIRQLVFITIELELIAVIFLCAGIYNTSYSHYNEFLEDFRAATTEIFAAKAVPSLYAGAAVSLYEDSKRWKGPVLSKSKGTVTGPSGKETYYNLNMDVVVRIMRRMGNTDKYWVRDDGVKMLGDYVMVAANLKLRPRGSLIETSLGTAIVCDTGGFASRNPTQIDVAVTW